MRLPINLKKLPFFWTIKLFFKRVVGRELWLSKELSIDTAILGEWEFCPQYINQHSVIYSLGVGDSIEFDLGIIKHHGCQVHAFDPTPYAVEWISDQNTPSELQFHPWAVSGKDGSLRMTQRTNKKGQKSEVMWTEVLSGSIAEDAIEVPVYSIPSIMRKLDHSFISLMKIDVEGTEYEIIDDILNNGVLPKQILIEFHHRFSSKSKKMTQNSLKSLRKFGYRIFSISATGREVGFIKLNNQEKDLESFMG
ncbi:MAG: FkbM family methyltransferase [Pseudomonadota bacterium]|nr:FkbM family methyltransferase [Pseudomonadota bacterium]